METIWKTVIEIINIETGEDLSNVLTIEQIRKDKSWEITKSTSTAKVTTINHKQHGTRTIRYQIQPTHTKQLKLW